MLWNHFSIFIQDATFGNKLQWHNFYTVSMLQNNFSRNIFTSKSTIKPIVQALIECHEPKLLSIYHHVYIIDLIGNQYVNLIDNTNSSQSSSVSLSLCMSQAQHFLIWHMKIFQATYIKDMGIYTYNGRTYMDEKKSYKFEK